MLGQLAVSTCAEPHCCTAVYTRVNHNCCGSSTSTTSQVAQRTEQYVTAVHKYLVPGTCNHTSTAAALQYIPLYNSYVSYHSGSYIEPAGRAGNPHYQVPGTRQWPPCLHLSTHFQIMEPTSVESLISGECTIPYTSYLVPDIPVQRYLACTNILYPKKQLN